MLLPLTPCLTIKGPVLPPMSPLSLSDPEAPPTALCPAIGFLSSLLSNQLGEISPIYRKLDVSVKENSKSKIFLTKYMQEIQNTVKRPNLKIVVMEGELSQL